MCRGHFYKVRLYDRQENLYPPSVLEQQFVYILEDSKEHEGAYLLGAPASYACRFACLLQCPRRKAACPLSPLGIEKVGPEFGRSTSAVV